MHPLVRCGDPMFFWSTYAAYRILFTTTRWTQHTWHMHAISLANSVMQYRYQASSTIINPNPSWTKSNLQECGHGKHHWNIFKFIFRNFIIFALTLVSSRIRMRIICLLRSCKMIILLVVTWTDSTTKEAIFSQKDSRINLSLVTHQHLRNIIWTNMYRTIGKLCIEQS